LIELEGCQNRRYVGERFMKRRDFIGFSVKQNWPYAIENGVA
jgi:hypothetical protein